MGKSSEFDPGRLTAFMSSTCFSYPAMSFETHDMKSSPPKYILVPCLRQNSIIQDVNNVTVQTKDYLKR